MEVTPKNRDIARSNYFIRPKKVDSPRARIITFPYAGAGAVAYHSWASLLPENIELISIQYPGRGGLFDVSPRTSIEDLSAESYETVVSFADDPYIIFGHSMGALVAYQTILSLRRDCQSLPKSFFVSACESPLSNSGLTRNLHKLPDDEFLDGIMSYGGMPEEIMQSTDMLSYVLPLLRADMTALETWRCPKEPSLNIPIVALGGNNDRLVDKIQLKRWSEFTNSKFTQRILPGDHFFIQNQLPDILDIVVSELEKTEI